MLKVKLKYFGQAQSGRSLLGTKRRIPLAVVLPRPARGAGTLIPSANESALLIRWPKDWSLSFNISPSNEHPGLISFRMDWLDLLAVQGTLKSRAAELQLCAQA